MYPICISVSAALTSFANSIYPVQMEFIQLEAEHALHSPAFFYYQFLWFMHSLLSVPARHKVPIPDPQDLGSLSVTDCGLPTGCDIVTPACS